MKPFATIQVDVDNIWSHLMDLGIEDYSQAHVIYEEAVVRFKALFAEFGIKATFFCIGRDALLPPVKQVIRALDESGHEIANHSHRHCQTFASLGQAEMRQEIAQAHEALRAITGKAPAGFKSPGWAAPNLMFEILNEQRYTYDSSILPSSFLPGLALARYILSRGVRTHKKYGRLSLCLAPLKPYIPNPRHPAFSSRTAQGVWELPNSTFPFIRTPIHTTFMYLFGRQYFLTGLRLLARRHLPLNFAFHAIDLLPENLDQRLSRFPAMRKNLSSRLDDCRMVLEAICQRFQCLTSLELARRYSDTVANSKA